MHDSCPSAFFFASECFVHRRCMLIKLKGLKIIFPFSFAWDEEGHDGHDWMEDDKMYRVSPYWYPGAYKFARIQVWMAMTSQFEYQFLDVSAHFYKMSRCVRSSVHPRLSETTTSITRCFLASLSEGVFVRPSIRNPFSQNQSVRTPTHSENHP